MREISLMHISFLHSEPFFWIIQSILVQIHNKALIITNISYNYLIIYKFFKSQDLLTYAELVVRLICRLNRKPL